MILTLFELTPAAAFFLDHLNSIIIGFNTLLGLITFISMMKYTRNELKTAPKYNLFQKSANFISGFAFSFGVACVVTFVFALISSMIAQNALFYVNNFRRELANYSQWIRALQFPQFLPVILVMMAFFAVLYSIFEYMLMARSSQDAPMEIQQWIEKTFIDRFRPPWSFIMALVVFIFIVLAAPTVISFLSLQIWVDLPPNAKVWLIALVFIVWIMLGPIFYLSYYSQIGIAQAYFRGRKSNLKKDKKTAFFYVIAILGIITTVYSFFKFLFLIFDSQPDTSLNPLEAQGPFWPYVLTFIRNNSTWFSEDQIQRFLAFFAILPTSFSLFLLTTCIFGLLGFYAKFLSKEPLNTPKMVLFAAYIIVGIAFSIFINSIVYFPYAFPTQFLNHLGFPLNTKVKADQIFMLRIFAVPLLVEKTINLVFLLRFLLSKKSIKEQVEKSILNQALSSQDLEILQKYLNSRDPSVQGLLTDHLIDYIKLKPKLSPAVKSQLSEIFIELLLNEGLQDRSLLIDNLNDISDIIPLEDKLKLISKLLQRKSQDSVKLGLTILDTLIRSTLATDIAIDDILPKIPKLIRISENVDISDKLAELLHRLQRKNDSDIQNFLINLLSTKNRAHLLFVYDYIINYPKSVAQKQTILINFIHQHLAIMDLELIQKTFQAYVRIASFQQDLIPGVMTEFNRLTINEPVVVREKIGALVQFNLIKPGWFEDFFRYMELFLHDPNIQIRADSMVALGSLTTPISKDQFFRFIHPYLKEAVVSDEIQIKKGVLSSLIVIAQTRKDIYKDERFQRLFTLLIVDNQPDIRHQVYRFFIQGDPQYLLADIAVLLKIPLDVIIRVDLLNTLSQISEDVIPYIDELELYDILFKQPLGENQKKLDIHAIRDLQEDKSTIFGFKQLSSEISVYDAVVSLLFEMTYMVPDKYPAVLEYMKRNQKYESDFSFAKQLEFYCKIVVDEISLIRTFGIDFSLSDLFQYCRNNANRIKDRSAEVLVEYLPRIYAEKPEFHQEIFEILANITRSSIALPNKSHADLLRLMSQITVEFQDVYFSPLKIEFYQQNKSYEKIPFKFVCIPYFLACMKIDNQEIQKSLIQSFTLFVDKMREQEIIRSFLLKTIIKSRESNIKISAMKAFVSLPMQIEDKKTVKTFLNQLKAKDSRVRAQAIECLGTILRVFPTIGPKEGGSNRKIVQHILYRAFFLEYSPNAPISVRTAIIEQLKTILLIQPNIPISLKILDQLSKESDEDLILGSLYILFDFIDFSSQDISGEAVVLYRYSNSEYLSVQVAIAEKIFGLWSQNMQVKSLFSIIINLATSEHSEVRKIVFSALFIIFRDNPQYVQDFFRNLFKLTKNEDENIRKDALEVILQIATDQAVLPEILHDIIQISQKMANDPSLEIKVKLSEWLVELIQKYPEYNAAYLQIIINFLRSNISRLVKNAVVASNALLQQKSELKQEFYKKGAKIFKKNQNPLLETLLSDIRKNQ